MGTSSIDCNAITARDSAISSQSSMQHDDENDTKMDELRRAISNAKTLIRRLNSHLVKSPIEESKFSQFVEDTDESNLFLKNTQTIESTPRDSSDCSARSIYEEANNNENLSEEVIMVTIRSLVKALDDSLRQIQQLKLKNMLLKSNSNDIQSTYEVEENLKRQQYERMKCQLLLENQQLVERLRIKEGKVAKYKTRIVEKNRQINKLTRILNENSIAETAYAPSSNQHLRKPSRTTSLDSSDSSKHKDKTSDMLRTLGILASQVLNDEADDDSANQTIPQIIDNTTETEVLQSPILENQLQTSSQILNRSFSGGDSKPLLNGSSIQLPKMRSFSTLKDGRRNES